MRIKFKCKVQQVDSNSVEIEMSHNGLPQPEVRIDNAAEAGAAWGISEADFDRIHDDLQRRALVEFVRASITIE